MAVGPIYIGITKSCIIPQCGRSKSLPACCRPLNGKLKDDRVIQTYSVGGGRAVSFYTRAHVAFEYCSHVTQYWACRNGGLDWQRSHADNSISEI